MNNSYSVIRAIRGPIVLITLGVLFAVQNFTRFDFGQTWPVLLIVFGLLSLMQRGAAPPPPPPPKMPPPRPYTTTGYAQSPYAQPPAGAPPQPVDPNVPGSSPSEGGSV